MAEGDAAGEILPRVTTIKRIEVRLSTLRFSGASPFSPGPNLS